MLIKDPKQRITIKEIIDHKWINVGLNPGEFR